MCLSTVDNTSGIEDGFGYKVFIVSVRGAMYPSVIVTSEKALRMSRWLKAIQTPILANDLQYYMSGFHIFKRKKDAMKYLAGSGKDHVLARVAYRNVTSQGLQRIYGMKKSFYDVPCVIASEMKILEKVVSR